MKCAEVRDNIAARRSGWLSSRDEAALDAHLAACDACRRQMDADARLSELLSALPQPRFASPTWAPVKAAHSPARRSRRWFWLAPAFGSAAVAAGVLWITLFGIGRTPGPQQVAMDTMDKAARETHLMFAASDLSGDPNRAVVVWLGDAGAK